MQRYLAQENRRQPTVLTEMPLEQFANKPASVIRVWRSRDFLVQEHIAQAPAMVRLSVNQTAISGDRWTDGITWDDLQRVKRETGYADSDAVEIFPADTDIVNVANMRHLWILPAGSLPFAWRKLKP